MDISVKITDIASGVPADGVAVRFEGNSGESDLGSLESYTDRAGHVVYSGALPRTEYRIVVASGGYFTRRDAPTCYPRIGVCLRTGEAETAYRVDLLVSPYGYQVQVSRDPWECAT